MESGAGRRTVVVRLFRRTLPLGIGLAGAILYPLSGAVGDDWPQWNGARFEMISHESGWAKDWSASPPTPRWSVDVGTGFSSVSVVSDRVYTMGRDADQDAVYCLNAADGSTIWKFTYDCELYANMHEGGPGSTPAVADGRVYAFSREGQLHCLDAETGDPVWDLSLTEVCGVEPPTWGLTSSPIIVDGRLYLDAGRLIALDAQTGSMIWQTEPRAAGYGSPILVNHDGRELVAALTNEGLVVVNASDGGEVAFVEWRTNWQTNSTTPIYFDGKFFLSTGYNRGCAVFRLAGDSLELVYESRAISNHMNNSVIYDGFIYGISGNSTVSKNCRLVCIRASDGEERWSKRGVGCGSLVLCDGHLIVLTDSGAMTCGPADPDDFVASGKVEPLEGRCWTVPVVAQGCCYCRNAAGTLVCLQLAKDR